MAGIFAFSDPHTCQCHDVEAGAPDQNANVNVDSQQLSGWLFAMHQAFNLFPYAQVRCCDLPQDKPWYRHSAAGERGSLRLA